MTTHRALFAILLMASVGCSARAPDARFTESVPDRASFPDVAQAMVHHCGSLDCHGTPYRNLRLYGNESLRWLAADRPLSPPCTTSREVDQDFDSVVGLEPELMTDVVLDQSPPEVLTLVRKPRGTEAHKGGTLMNPGDDLDLCIVSWLSGQPREDACQHVGPPTVPPPSEGQAPACLPGP